MNYYNQSVKATLLKLKTSPDGLNYNQLPSRVKKYGKNVIKVQSKSLLQQIVEPFADIFMIVLIIASLISWHQNQLIDAWVIIVIIAINVGIHYLQAFSTQRILRSLNKQASQAVIVKRQGQLAKIDSEDLTVGDVFYLTEGDKVPADGRIIEAEGARLDESMLTGESLPISKNSSKITSPKAVYEQRNMVFAGSFVVAGNLTVVTTATGMNSEFGKIANFSKRAGSLSPIQSKINKLITQIIIATTVVMLGILLVLLARGGDFETSLGFILATTVSVIPESLPVAITIILALSMKRMAGKKSLVRNLHAIEAIGVVNIISTDKTGTLTKNQLSIVKSWTLTNQTDFEQALIGTMIGGREGNFADPLDKALYNFSIKQKINLPDYRLIRYLPFEQNLAMSGAHYQDNQQEIVFIKGAPEKVIALSKLSAAAKRQVEQALNQMIDDGGGRIIAIAKFKPQRTFTGLGSLNQPLEFMGLIELADQIRPEAKAAVREAQSAGIKVVMITGDHVKTALAIAKQVGIASQANQVLDVSTINDVESAEFKDQVLACSVFARVTPEVKFKILEILKQSNITAMTGDGVNDVPALIESHTGIAMGSGSSIAKDASDIIILDDNFKSIVTAVKEGRTTVHNIRRLLFYLLSTNLGELLTFIIAVAFGMPLPLAAIQILWINLFTDTVFVIPLGLQPAQDNIMKAKPKSPDAPLLNRFYLIRIALVSGLMAVLATAIYRHFAAQGALYAQTMTFTALVVSQWANAFNATSFSLSLFDKAKKPNRLMWLALICSIIIQLIVIYTPLNQFLKLTSVAVGDLITVAALSALALLTSVELHKIINRVLYFQPFYK